jgi:hypothetical protein
MLGKLQQIVRSGLNVLKLHTCSPNHENCDGHVGEEAGRGPRLWTGTLDIKY